MCGGMWRCGGVWRCGGEVWMCVRVDVWRCVRVCLLSTDVID